MKTISFLSLGCLVLILMACTKNTIEYTTDKNPAVQSELQAMVDQVMTAYKAKYPGYPGGLAMQVIGKSGSWFVSSGMPAGTTNQIHFRAASNTKTFTSSAILLLYQQGKLNVNARITDTIPGTNMTYLPDDPGYAIPFKEQITIHQLLQHKAGIFDISNDEIPDTVSAEVPYKGMNYLGWVMVQDPTHTFTFDELIAVNAVCRLFYFPPGKGYHYSNTGYSILGKIIERVSGMNYSAFVMSQIIEPMKLTHSSMPYLGTDRQLPEPFAHGYYYLPEVTDCSVSNISANVAEGNLITTPADLAHFLRLLIRGEGVLSAYTVNNMMLAPLIPPDTMTRYTCGITYTTNLGYGHSGAHEGYLSRMVTDPEADITIMIFTNAWNGVPGLMPGLTEQIAMLLEESCYKAKYIVME